MFLGGNQYKRPLVSQYSKNDIAEFVHDRSERGHFGFAFALLLVVGAEDRILWLTVLAQTDRLQRQYIEAAAGIGRTTLGNAQICPCGVPGLPYHRVKPEIGVELLRAAERGEIPDLADNGNSRQETGSWYGFQQLGLSCKL